MNTIKLIQGCLQLGTIGAVVFSHAGIRVDGVTDSKEFSTVGELERYLISISTVPTAEEKEVWTFGKYKLIQNNVGTWTMLRKRSIVGDISSTDGISFCARLFAGHSSNSLSSLETACYKLMAMHSTREDKRQRTGKIR